jgi:hypothetical protein
MRHFRHLLKIDPTRTCRKVLPKPWQVDFRSEFLRRVRNARYAALGSLAL